VQLRAAVDVGAVALDDNGELHDSCDPPPPPSGPAPSDPPPDDPPADPPPRDPGEGGGSEPAWTLERVTAAMLPRD
jgi:hypothetical protein